MVLLRGEKMKKKINQILPMRGYIIIAISLVFIISGYIIMSTGDRTVSIILLILAYIVLIPTALLITNKKKEKE